MKNNATVDRIQAVWNLAGGERGVDDLIAGEAEFVLKKFLEPGEEFSLTPWVGQAKAAEKFAEATDPESEISFSCSERFRDVFLGPDCEIGVSLGVSDFIVQHHEVVTGYCFDKSVFRRLGEPKKIGFELNSLYAMVKQQGCGKPGHLLTDGRHNVFYVMDQWGEVWTVMVSWNSVSWSMQADCIGARRLIRGTRVFAKKP